MYVFMYSLTNQVMYTCTGAHKHNVYKVQIATKKNYQRCFFSQLNYSCLLLFLIYKDYATLKTTTSILIHLEVLFLR